MMRGRHVLAVCLLLAIGAAAVIAQQKSPQQQQRTPAEYATFLEQADRVARLQIPRVVAALELKKGMTVADIGAGSGLFARPIAQAVAPGIVYAVDIDAELLQILAARAADAGVTNIKTILGRPADPALPAPVDLVFICDSLHHIADQAAYMKTIRRSLAPGGRVAIIDYARNWPEGHDKLLFSAAQLESWMKAAGLTPVATHGWIQDSFFTIYR